MGAQVELAEGTEAHIVKHFGLAPMIDLLRSLQRPLPHMNFGPWTPSSAPRRGEYGDITVFKKNSSQVRVRIRIADGAGLASNVSTLAGVALPPFDREALRSFADFVGTLVESIGSISSNINFKRRTDISPANIDIGSLAVGRYLRSMAHLAFDPTPILLHLRALSQQTYEGQNIAYGLMLTRRQGGMGTFPADIQLNKRYRSVSDGERTALRLDREGRVLGLAALPTGDEGPARAYHPRRFDELASGSYREVMGFGLSLEGDIVCLQKSDMIVSMRQGRWQVWNHQENVSVLRRAILALTTSRKSKKPKNIDKFVRQLYSASLDLSFRRKGALFVVLDDPKAIDQLIDDRQLPGAEGRALSDLGLDRTIQRRNRDVSHLSRDVLVDLAGLDGAVIVGPSGRMLAYGAIVKLSPEGQNFNRGARTTACMEASRFGVAIMVSADGGISIVTRGKRILQL